MGVGRSKDRASAEEIVCLPVADSLDSKRKPMRSARRVFSLCRSLWCYPPFALRRIAMRSFSAWVIYMERQILERMISKLRPESPYTVFHNSLVHPLTAILSTKAPPQNSAWCEEAKSNVRRNEKSPAQRAAWNPNACGCLRPFCPYVALHKA